MPKNIRSALRSSRSSFFREPKRQAARRRSQRVKFRPRYAKSVMRQTGAAVWKLARVILLSGAIGASGFYGFRFWSTSDRLRVAAVQFQIGVPVKLQRTFPVKIGDHLLKLRPRRMERELLAQFPELERLTIERTWFREVRVVGIYRTPLAFVEKDGRVAGLDAHGFVFPIDEQKVPVDSRPHVRGNLNPEQLKPVVEALVTLEHNVPRFYSMVKSLETDNIGAVRMTLDDGAVIEWGEMKKETLETMAQNILLLTQRFAPVKVPAVLRVITANRIVMDSNWTQIKKG